MRDVYLHTHRNNKALRILHITGMRSKKFGSIERWFVELARQCRQRGHSLIICYVGQPASEKYREVLADLGVQVVAQEERLTSFQHLRLYLRLIRTYRPHVVHTHFDPYCHLGNVAGLLSRVKHRCRTYHSMTRYETMPRPARWRSMLIGRVSSRLVHRSFAVSRAVLQDFSPQVSARTPITLLPLGIDCGSYMRTAAQRGLIRKEFGIGETDCVIGTVSRADPVKGLDVLVQAFAEVHATFPTTHALIAGGDQGLDDLRELARTVDVDRGVTFAGTRNDIPAVLSAMDLFVLPSRSEGMPLSLLEALSAGLPVVASNVGGIPEVIADGVSGFLVPPGDPHRLASAIADVIREPDRSGKVGMAGKRYVEEHFSVVNQVSRLMESYEAGVA